MVIAIAVTPFWLVPIGRRGWCRTWHASRWCASRWASRVGGRGHVPRHPSCRSPFRRAFRVRTGWHASRIGSRHALLRTGRATRVGPGIASRIGSGLAAGIHARLGTYLCPFGLFQEVGEDLRGGIDRVRASRALGELRHRLNQARIGLALCSVVILLNPVSQIVRQDSLRFLLLLFRGGPLWLRRRGFRGRARRGLFVPRRWCSRLLRVAPAAVRDQRQAQHQQPEPDPGSVAASHVLSGAALGPPCPPALAA